MERTQDRARRPFREWLELLIHPLGWKDLAFFATAVFAVATVTFLELAGASLGRAEDIALHAIFVVAATVYVVVSVRRRRLLRYFREAIEKTPSAFALYDNRDVLVARNRAYEEVHAEAFAKLHEPIRYRDLLRASLGDDLTGADAEAEFDRRLRAHRDATGEAVDRLYPNGRWLRVLKARTETGANVGVAMDVTELYAAKAAADREHLRFRGVAETLPVGIWHFDAEGRTIFVNRQLLAMFGIDDEAELAGVAAPEFIAAHVEGFEAARKSTGYDDLGNLTIRSPRGEAHHIIIRTSALPPDPTGAGETIMSFIDVTALKEAERRIDFLAHRDMLTGTRNRAAFVAAIQTAAAFATQAKPCWILAMDLDGFKPVNDQYGHAAGDSLLREFARRIEDIRPDDSAFYRLGGDEFCLLLSGGSRTEVEVTVAAMLAAAAAPFTLGHARVNVTMSIGIAAMPLDTNEPETAQRYADLALYAVKARGGNACEFFTREHAERDHRERILTLDLARALPNDEFSCVFQPLIAPADHAIMGVEMLLRWRNQRTGQNVGPSEFIPAAERAGVVSGIDLWVLARAARQLAVWQARGIDLPVIMVNMSPLTLENGDFLARLDEILAQHPQIRERVCIEITEGVVIKDRARLGHTFEELGRRGIRTAIDDFGTGQTSVALLRDLPVSFIKIDRSYIEGVATDSQARAIVSSIIGLGRQLGVTVIGEGVETEEQLAALEEAGCELVQGYLLGRPVPAARIEDLFAAGARIQYDRPRAADG